MEPEMWLISKLLLRSLSIPPCVAVAHLDAVVLPAADVVADLVPAMAAAHDALRAAH